MTDAAPDALADAVSLPALMDRIENLEPELQSLLVTSLLVKMSDMLSSVCEDPELPGRTAGMLALVRNVLNLAGLTAQTQHKAHEDWTRTGDNRVDAVWTDYVKILDTLTFTPEDLPQDLADRLRDGTATDEDHEHMLRLVAEKAGIDPSDVEIEHILADVKSQTQPVEAKTDNGGTGMYL